MNNSDVYNLIAECLSELRRVKKAVDGNKTNEMARFLTNYAIIRASGTIEQSYKTLVADKLTRNSKINKKIRIYVDNNVRKSPSTANYSVICGFLGKFDEKTDPVKEQWGKRFSDACNNSRHSTNIFSSYENLSKARNAVAHGKATVMTIEQVLLAYKYCRKSIKLLDQIIK